MTATTGVPSGGAAEPPFVTTADYARAESFLPWHVRERIFGAGVRPHWIAAGERFWYTVTTREGKRFFVVEADTGARRPAFDQDRLAAELSAALSAASGERHRAEALPFDDLTFCSEETSDEETGEFVEFEAAGRRWRCDLADYDCRRVPEIVGLPSPDGRRAVFVSDHNLWLRDLETGEETSLTDDGRAGRAYATPLPSPLVAAGLAPANSDKLENPAVLWSPDSRRLLTHRLDVPPGGDLTLVQSAPPDGRVRPRSVGYAYPLPGDDPVPAAELMLVDVESHVRTRTGVPAIDLLYYGTPLRRDPDRPGSRSAWWNDDGSRCFVLHRTRGNRTLALYEVDAATGAARVVVEESDDTPVDANITVAGDPNVRIFSDGDRVLWYSHRDGWGHLYLYDATTGTVVRQLTSGAWAVADVVHVDEERRVVYVTGIGREPGRDPYDRLLYRVPLDGGEPVLLTPDDGSHLVSIAPNGRHFVTIRARMDTAPVTDLCRIDGTRVTTLETVDVADLTAAGWTFPERFTATARDGETTVCGVLIRPSTFDPARKYPVIDAIYAGPQTNQAPASFAEITHEHGDNFWHAQAIAELGFVVVMVDGLGMPYRSKTFRDVSYRNLADAGLPEHVLALCRLAETRPYLDIDRVGIYGHSAGGYASCRAILAYPDFYRVCVSSAGNHDHRLDKAWWVERYMGHPVGDHYREQANPTLAHRLRGRLLLMHGEMDENVPVSATLALANALIEADKDFDLLILPNRTHGCGGDPYVVRRRWDYFVRHLAGEVPPPYHVSGASTQARP